MKYLLLFLLFTSTTVLVAQKGPIKVTSSQAGNEVIITGKNTSNVDRQVDLSIKSRGFGKKGDVAVSKVIPAKSSLTLISMQPLPGKKVSLTYEFSQKVAVKKAAVASNESKAAASSEDQSESSQSTTTDPATSAVPNKDITIYHKAGCARCDMAVDYLRKYNVPFTKLDISKNKENHAAMSKLLFSAGFKGGSFLTPVITVGDEVHYDIKDLRGFLFRFLGKNENEANNTTAKGIESQVEAADATPKGITIYHKKGCHRCEMAISYLRKNKIPFEKLDITRNPDNEMQMWELLKTDGFKDKGFQTPLIVVGDEVHYNIQDLPGFLEGLNR